MLGSGGSGVSTTGKSMAVNPKNQPTYTVQNGQLVAVPSKTGVASKQSQPIVNAQGQVISGAYTTNSAGKFQEIPMQSLGYNTGSLDKTNNVQKIADRLNLSLNETKGSAWDSVGTKSDKMRGIMESTAGEFGKNFNSADEMNFAYNSNPTVKNALDQFVANGGTLEQIASKIQANQAQAQPYTIQQGDTLNAIANRTGKSVQELMALNPQITNPNLIQAGASLNLGQNVQPTTTYLGELQKQYVTDPETLLNMPQDELMRNEVMRQMNIPQEMKDYYFGTPEKMGVFEREKAMKQAELDLIDEKLADDKRAYREKSQLSIDKTRAELGMALAETETNRLKAKNYMTGLLAKLGALNTTGAAGEALVKLDQKYEEMKLNTTTKYNLAIRQMENEMNEGLNDIENGYADKAQAVREDLTKSEASITKELMKLQQESQSKIYSLASSYAKLVQTQKDKALKALKTGANEYITEWRDIVSIDKTPGLVYAGGDRTLNDTFLQKIGTKIATQVPVYNFTKTELEKIKRAGLSNAPQSVKNAFIEKGTKTPTKKTEETSSDITDEQFLAELRG
jgi:LysM repeat protein